MLWKKYIENGRTYIRRSINGKNPRMPTKKYRHLKTDAEIDSFILRMNAPIELSLKVDFKHAFIDDHLMSEYLEYLLAQIPNQMNAKTEFGYLKRYALNFFITQLGLNRISEWYEVHETKWSAYLLSSKCPKSEKTKKDIINALNRFVGWLHKRRPTEITLVKFTPITKAVFKNSEAKRHLRGDVHEPKMIAQEDWIRLKQSIPDCICPQVMLAYHYGLRRSETLAVSLSSIRKQYLYIDSQVLTIGNKNVLKGMKPRKVPHWFEEPNNTYRWVSMLTIMHPSTLSRRWAKYVKSMGMSYTFHDLRHTFTTRAIRLYEARDVQLACGHVDLSTTMAYLHDDRALGDEVFVPNKAS